MKRLLLSLSLILFAFACSPNMLETAYGEIPCNNDGEAPLTRAVEDETEDEYLLRYESQSNHYLMLMRHVEFCDSVYVQTLTEDDFASLHITEDEQAFGEAYVLQLNALSQSVVEPL